MRKHTVVSILALSLGLVACDLPSEPSIITKSEKVEDAPCDRRFFPAEDCTVTADGVMKARPKS